MKQIKSYSEFLQGVAIGLIIGAGLTIIVFSIVLLPKILK